MTPSAYAPEHETLSTGSEYPPLDLAARESLLQGSRARHQAFLALACLLVDAAMLVAAMAIQLASPLNGGKPSPVWPLAFAGLTLWIFAARGSYAPRLRLRLLEDLRMIVSVTAISAMAVISTRVLVGDGGDIAAETVHYWLLAMLLLGTGRTVLLRSEKRARRRGEAVLPTLVVGAGRLGRLTAQRLLDEPELGLRPIGFVDPDPLDAEEGFTPLPVLGDGSDLDRLVADNGIQHVVVTFSRAPHAALLSLVRRCRELGLRVSILPRLFEVEGDRARVERLGSLPLVAVSSADPGGWQFRLKYGIERAVAALALTLTLPLFALAAIAVKLTMGGPVLFRQRRVGADGREFDMLKLRTMKGRPEEDEEADLDWALEQLGRSGETPDISDLPAWPTVSNDRRTRVGRLLRRFSMDELPQLWNVVRGEMSLVGPRPERVAYVRYFQRSIYRYAERHRVRSGITGWAQVHGLRGKTSLRDRVEWDNYYIENWSPWLDVKIFLMTVACIVRGQHEEDQWR